MTKIRETAEQIINKIYSGMSLRAAFDDDKTGLRQFFEQLSENPELAQRYTLAQQARAEILADEIIEISDHEVDPNRARVRVDARKWYASKMTPQKYGDRIDLNINQPVDILGAISEAKKRTVLSTCYSVDTTSTQPIEIIEQIEDMSTGSKPVNNDKSQETSNNNSSEDIFS